MSHIFYKYIDITGGKYMMGATKPQTPPNLQFTNASQLNDPFDCHPNLIDFTNLPPEILRVPDEEYHKFMIEKEQCDASNLKDDIWLCSLSKTHESLLMWTHYCHNHKGICIGLNMEQVIASTPANGFGTIMIKPEEIEVQYLDLLERPDYYRSCVNPRYYQLQTKAKDWAYEQEVRLVIENPNPMYAAYTPEQKAQIKNGRKEFDWKEIRHYLPLKGECFEEIYFGVKVEPTEKEKIINFARKKLNPDIKLYQMQIDENAFRLKAEVIE